MAWKMAIPTVFHDESALNEEVKGGQNVYSNRACTEYTDETFNIGSSFSFGKYLVIGLIVISANAAFKDGAKVINVSVDK
jgi:hypothetical protein